MTSLPLLCQPIENQHIYPEASLSRQAFVMDRQSPRKTVFQTESYLIRYLLQGSESFRVGHDTYLVKEGEYLILNPHPQVHFSGLTESKGLWVALSPQDVHAYLAGEQLREPSKWSESKLFNKDLPEMCEQAYPAQDDRLGRWLNEWSQRMLEPGPANDSLFKAAYRQSMIRLISSQYEAYRCMGQLNSAKRTTKLELYKRLCIARNYIHDHLSHNLDLDTLAQVACLSKYHFIRLFKEAFGETPRQYLIGKRLERARNLLLHTHLTFHEICHEVGLKDSSSFGRLFKRTFGATPQVFRQQFA